MRFWSFRSDAPEGGKPAWYWVGGSKHTSSPVANALSAAHRQFQAEELRFIVGDKAKTFMFCMGLQGGQR